MIKILPVKKWRDCNVCMEDASIEVYFRSNFTNQGTIIALCDNCAKYMCDILAEEMKGRKNDNEEQ